MTDPAQAFETGLPTPRRRRWLGAALVVSLTLNVLVAGAVAGWAWRRHAEPDPAHRFSLGALSRDGRPMERDRARDVLRSRGPAFEQARRTVETARQAVRDAVTADPFAPEALSAALADLRAAETAVSAQRHGALVDLAQGLSPERRAELAARLSRGRRP